MPKATVDTAEVILAEYRDEKIDSVEAMRRSTNLPLPEMSIVATLASVLDSYVPGESTGTRSVIEDSRRAYLSFVATAGAPPEEFTFTDFIKHITTQLKHPREEFSRVDDAEKFWQLVAEIEQHI